jgi:hypothetical protein
MIELTEQQRRELAQSPETPPRVVDPATQAAYVLLPVDLYERVRSIVEDEEIDMAKVGLLVDRAMREDDTGDPTLDFYQQKYGQGK